MFTPIKELIDYRHILQSLVLDRLIGRYKSTKLGILWHFFTPILMLIVYYVAFEAFKTHDVPNMWLYIASGLFVFSYLLSCITGGTTCILSQSSILKKIYFPKEIVVYAYSISSLIIMGISYGITILCSIVFGTISVINLLWILPFTILAFVFGTGCLFLVSTITVYIRDIQHALNAINVGFYLLTPIYFFPTNIDGFISSILSINPLFYYVEAFHEILYYNTTPNLYLTEICIILAVTTYIVGYSTFAMLKKGLLERL